jgi:hypothetical protein
MNKTENIENSNKFWKNVIFGSDFYQFFIAGILIIAFLIILSLNFPSDETYAQGIFTGFIAWIGTIVGFYFGQKPVKEISHNLEVQASKTSIESKRAKEAIKTIKFLNEQIEEIKRDLIGDNDD